MSIYTKFVVCKYFQFGQGQNLSTSKGLNDSSMLQVLTLCKLIITFDKL